MEHEVFVPVPAESLRQALGDPARVARCVPGLQQDADEASGPLAGRLKVRIDGHTITYRGTLRVTGQPDGTFAVEGEGTEARGTGSVKLALTARLTEAEGGTTVTYAGTASGEGRIAELDTTATLSASRRLLDRFTSGLADAPAGDGRGAAEGDGVGGAGGAEGAGGAAGTSRAGEASGASGVDGAKGAEAAEEAGGAKGGEAAEGAGGAGGASRAGADDGASGAGEADGAKRAEAAGADGADAGGESGASVFETDVPPPSLDPMADVPDMPDVADASGLSEDVPGVPSPAEPPAEAAHARRTMIGRSAEEVDHAPPRGRYAPVPAPQSTSTSETLRWIAPAAALALASAVVVSRALRRRR